MIILLLQYDDNVMAVYDDPVTAVCDDNVMVVYDDPVTRFDTMSTRLHKSRSSRSELEFDLSNFV